MSVGAKEDLAVGDALVALLGSPRSATSSFFVFLPLSFRIQPFRTVRHPKLASPQIYFRRHGLDPLQYLAAPLLKPELNLEKLPAFGATPVLLIPTNADAEATEGSRQIFNW